MTFDEMQLIMQQLLINQRETQDIVKSIARGIQAMQDKALSDELKRDEERAEHQARMEKLERISERLVNMLDAIDSDRPTILRRLRDLQVINQSSSISESRVCYPVRVTHRLRDWDDLIFGSPLIRLPKAGFQPTRAKRMRLSNG